MPFLTQYQHTIFGMTHVFDSPEIGNHRVAQRIHQDYEGVRCSTFCSTPRASFIQLPSGNGILIATLIGIPIPIPKAS